MPRTSLVVIGGSAGGVQALRRLLPGIPSDLDAAVAIALHRVAGEHEDRLAQLLQKSCALPVKTAQNGLPIENHHVYIAPPGVHLEVSDDRFRLTASPRENGSRPSIDVLFRTAADSPGRKVIGVLLSGLLDDGVSGLAEIKDAGGYAIVQTPSDAMYADMPKNALTNVEIDAVCDADEIGACIVKALQRLTVVNGKREITNDRPSPYSCPDCGGVLWELNQSGELHYLCRVGHSYGPSSLYTRKDEELEAALWTAVRALEERANLSETFAGRLRKRGLTAAASRLERQAEMAKERADTVRRTVTDLTFREDAVHADHHETVASND